MPAYLAALFFAFLCMTFVSCGGDSSAQTDPQADYDAAVQDAITMTAAKISKNLTAIIPGNPTLRGRTIYREPACSSATWIGSQSACENYSNPATPGCKAGQECTNYGYNSWVSVVPELKSLLGNAPTLLRVAQALGLPPPSGSQTLRISSTAWPVLMMVLETRQTHGRTNLRLYLLAGFPQVFLYLSGVLLPLVLFRPFQSFIAAVAGFVVHLSLNWRYTVEDHDHCIMFSRQIRGKTKCIRRVLRKISGVKYLVDWRDHRSRLYVRSLSGPSGVHHIKTGVTRFCPYQ